MDRFEAGHLGAPVWRAGERAGLARALGAEVRADVVVVGAGITGLTAAWLLQSQGRAVAVVEAQAVGAGTTGATSALLRDLKPRPLPHELAAASAPGGDHEKSSRRD
jgi:heterodisulfide reductase subunit A-like polyferredoxin